MRTPDYVVWLYPDSVQHSWNVALLSGWGIHEDDVNITGRRHPEGMAPVPMAIIQEREAGSNSSIGFSSGSSS